MKAILLALVTVASVSASAMTNTNDLTCAQASDLVTSSGAIVLATGTYTYDRYVAHAGFCGRHETTVPAWVPTADSAQCFIGYTCGQRSGGN